MSLILTRSFALEFACEVLRLHLPCSISLSKQTNDGSFPTVLLGFHVPAVSRPSSRSSAWDPASSITPVWPLHGGILRAGLQTAREIVLMPFLCSYLYGAEATYSATPGHMFIEICFGAPLVYKQRASVDG